MHDSPLHLVAESIIVLAVILISAKLLGELFFRFLKLPRVIGELSAGIIIGPYALGGLVLGGFGPFIHLDDSLMHLSLRMLLIKFVFYVFGLLRKG